MTRFLLVVCAALALCVPRLSAQEVVFEDRFEGALQPGWIWLRDNPGSRRFADNALEILTEPLYAAGEAANALMRPLNFWTWQNGRAQGSYRIETECYFLEPPTNQFQQCGFYWLRRNRIIFKLVFVNVDGRMCVFPGKAPIDSRGGKLRMTITGQRVLAEFCSLGETNFRRVYEGKIDCLPTDRISLQCWGGESQENGAPNPSNDWTRFRYFRVEKLSD